jgi:Transposase
VAEPDVASRLDRTEPLGSQKDGMCQEPSDLKRTIAAPAPELKEHPWLSPLASMSTARRSPSTPSMRRRGRSRRAASPPPIGPTLRRFLAGFAGQEVRAALEATTGWRFVCEEIQHIAAEVHLAEPADTRAARGTKRRAKTDRLDARHLRELLLDGRLPESWIPPAHIIELRSQVRLRHTLVDEARRGSSASTRSSSTTASPARAASPAAMRKSAWQSSTSRRRPADRSTSPSPWSRRSTRTSPRSTASFAPSPAASRAVARSWSIRGSGRAWRPPCWPSSGTPGAFLPRATRSASPGSTSPSTSQTTSAVPAGSPARGRPSCAGRPSRRRRRRVGPTRPTTPTT